MLVYRICYIVFVSYLYIAVSFCFQKGDLNDYMYQALMQDRHEFVKLFLEQGFSLEEFLTVYTLEKLYTDQLKRLVGYLRMSQVSYIHFYVFVGNFSFLVNIHNLYGSYLVYYLQMKKCDMNLLKQQAMFLWSSCGNVLSTESRISYSTLSLVSNRTTFLVRIILVYMSSL